MKIKSIKPRRSMVEQVYERILDAICGGELAAGERVTQDELAAILSCSRQPVMTALGLLRQQGFLVEHGRRGLQVAPVDMSRFVAIFELRSAIEPLAASLAAKRATAEQIEQGRRHIEAGREAIAMGDPGAVLLADVAFHTWVYEASANALIEESMETHWQHMRRAMGEVLRHPELAHKIWDEHEDVLKFIEGRHASEAARALSEHVTNAFRFVTIDIESSGHGTPDVKRVGSNLTPIPFS